MQFSELCLVGTFVCDREYFVVTKLGLFFATLS